MEIERLGGDRMQESDSFSMQHDAHRHGQSRILLPAVGLVSEQRMADRFEVDPDLVGAPAVNATAHKRGLIPKDLDDLPIRARRTSAFSDSHALAMHGMPGDCAVNHATLQPGHA